MKRKMNPVIHASKWREHRDFALAGQITESQRVVRATAIPN
jgi:hypothetical protein